MAKDWSREWRSTGTRSLVRPVLAVVGLGVVGLAPLVAVARGALPSWLTVPAAILAFAASTVLLVAVVMLCQSARLAGLLRGVRRAEPGALLAGARVDRDRLRRATGLDGELSNVSIAVTATSDGLGLWREAPRADRRASMCLVPWSDVERLGVDSVRGAGEEGKGSWDSLGLAFRSGRIVHHLSLGLVHRVPIARWVPLAGIEDVAARCAVLAGRPLDGRAEVDPRRDVEE